MKAPRAGDHSALVIANSDGAAQRVLVSDKEDNLKPTFVPHSNQMLFLRSAAFEHHSPLVDNRRHKFDLYSVDIGTGRVTALTDQRFYEITSVSASHDGKHAAITVDTYPEGAHFLIFSLEDPQRPPRSLQPIVPNAAGCPTLVRRCCGQGGGRESSTALATTRTGRSVMRSQSGA